MSGIRADMNINIMYTNTYIYIHVHICINIQEADDIQWSKPLKWTFPYYTFCFCLYQDYLTFDFIFKSEPHIPSFQMGIVILSGIHKKWLVLEQFQRNTQIIGSVLFSTRVVKKCSVCDRCDQNLGLEAQGPLMLEYRNRDDIMGTLVCCSSVLQ